MESADRSICINIPAERSMTAAWLCSTRGGRGESLVDDGRCRAIGHQFERTVAPLWICTNQASRSASRVASASSGDGASGILQGKWSCIFSFRAFGSWSKTGAARRSSDFGNRCTSWKDARTGVTGVGGATTG